ncbi:efflux transporter, RND family, MFP subunit, partial [Vibrio parahaemolyticus AQ3810]
MARFV